MKHTRLILAAVILACVAGPARAETVVRMFLLTQDGPGAVAGTIHAADAQGGLRLTPRLKGLPPGRHAFHVNRDGDCAAGIADGRKVPGGAAGPVYQGKPPATTIGPEGSGRRRGDLPPLVVGADGVARAAVLAQGLRLSEIAGRSLLIDGGEGSAPGAVACGVIPK